MQMNNGYESHNTVIFATIHYDVQMSKAVQRKMLLFGEKQVRMDLKAINTVPDANVTVIIKGRGGGLIGFPRVCSS